MIKARADALIQVIKNTLKKAAIVTTTKALTSDSRVNPIKSLTSGNADVKAAAISSATLPAPTQTIHETLGLADNSQPSTSYVANSSTKETQGSFFFNILFMPFLPEDT